MTQQYRLMFIAALLGPVLIIARVDQRNRIEVAVTTPKHLMDPR